MQLGRLRKNQLTRDFTAETKISVDNFVMPYFVIAGKKRKEPIESMPGIDRLSIDNLVEDIKEIKSFGIKAALLFGLANKKDASGSESYAKDGIIQKAVRAIKKEVKDILVITDVCLCGYTSHGHCGIVVDGPHSTVHSPQERRELFIDNDETLKILSKIALSQAEAGADLVAPSAMMDGQVGRIRGILDKNGFGDTGILAYSAKYASNFYGPFREALNSTPQFGSRKSYQMDFRNTDEALREIERDIQEGADIVMVKPALSYLDVIYRVKQNFNISLAAYNTSGEYAMVKTYIQGTGDRRQGAEIEKRLAIEILTSIKRAGADLIISYYAKEAAKWLMHNL